MYRSHHISVIIPARNESDALRTLLPRIPDWVDRIIVVDNASSDGSGRVAEALGADVLREDRIGYGAACATGLASALASDTQIVIFLDGDGSDDPQEMARLVDPIVDGQAGLAIGVRCACETMPLHQRLGTMLVCSILSVGFGTRVRDLGPFRAGSAAVLADLPLLDRGFGWTAEMQAEAMRFGVPIVEVEVSWRRGMGESEITGSWRGVARAARDLIRHSLREVLVYRVECLMQRIRRRPSHGGEAAASGPAGRKRLVYQRSLPWKITR